ncbi:MAG: HD domain-containing protein [Prolixibacteraceae bacterium]|nr:HD domain-containing protein [Prolixibacteraceae bacterium]
MNDPVFGFFSLQSELVFDLIEHPFFQRLRRIKQLGLTFQVFPGANHTRFEHALGAAYLMRQAILTLKNKGHNITDEEAEAVTIAILLHDIGHGPFSHVLENSLVNISHEEISVLLMEEINRETGGKLDLAIKIFKHKYPKKYLCQLIAGQLDMDRLDYLGRDSFFTGVTEGRVGVDRIIKMLNVWNDNLVIEIKGIYSIEKFLIARRLMYWLVYMHKTVVSAEFLLINILNRAKELAAKGEKLFATPSFSIFLKNQFQPDDFRKNISVEGMPLLKHFTMLDDNDIMASVKVWQEHPDPILSYLSKSLINRKLFKVIASDKPFPAKKIKKLKTAVKNQFNVTDNEIGYYYIDQELTNIAYSKDSENIKILSKKGKIVEFSQASDINISAFSKVVHKFFLCFPKELDIN